MTCEIYQISIESGTGGGSVSVYQNRKLLDFRIRFETDRKADVLLEDISDILKERKIEKSKISAIFYSESPGSHTGLKIGASIAKGLHLALNAELIKRNLFECIFKRFQTITSSKLLIVLPVSRSDSVWRIYDENGLASGIGQMNIFKDVDEFNINKPLDNLRVITPLHLILDKTLFYRKFGIDKQVEILDPGENLSDYLIY